MEKPNSGLKRDRIYFLLWTPQNLKIFKGRYDFSLLVHERMIVYIMASQPVFSKKPGHTDPLVSMTKPCI